MIISHTMNPVDHFRGYLRQNGLTFTTARSAILEGIVTSDGHFDADELQEHLRKRGERLSAATIYRTLPLFVDSGIIRETLPSRGRTRYEHAWGREHHDHLECLRCGAIIEFKDDELERIQTKVCGRHGFQAIDHRLAIRGYCASCQKR